MLVRNVTTDIRGGFSGSRIEDNNSIFVFEVAGLCIGHLGHLHHEPSDETYAAIGRLDKALDEALDNDWLIIDMQRDWRTIYPPSAATATD